MRSFSQAAPRPDNHPHVRFIVPYSNSFLHWLEMVRASIGLTTMPDNHAEYLRMLIVIDKSHPSQTQLIPSDSNRLEWPLGIPLHAAICVQSCYSLQAGIVQIAQYPIRVILLGTLALARSQHVLPLVVPLITWVRFGQCFHFLKKDTDAAGTPPTSVDYFDFHWLRDVSCLQVRREYASLSKSPSSSGLVSLEMTCISSDDAVAICNAREPQEFFDDWKDDMMLAKRHLANTISWCAQTDAKQRHVAVRLSTQHLRSVLEQMATLVSNKSSAASKPNDNPSSGNSLVEILVQAFIVGDTVAEAEIETRFALRISTDSYDNDQFATNHEEALSLMEQFAPTRTPAAAIIAALRSSGVTSEDAIQEHFDRIVAPRNVLRVNLLPFMNLVGKNGPPEITIIFFNDGEFDVMAVHYERLLNWDALKNHGENTDAQDALDDAAPLTLLDQDGIRLLIASLKSVVPTVPAFNRSGEPEPPISYEKRMSFLQSRQYRHANAEDGLTDIVFDPLGRMRTNRTSSKSTLTVHTTEEELVDPDAFDLDYGET